MKLYYDDFANAPRRCEASEKVAFLWLKDRVQYDVESDVSDAAFRGIVAERIVLRRMLGLGSLERLHVPYVLDAQPFGAEGPKLAEFILPNVFAAMAFVPLTPLGGTGRPVLARLYCVRGLSRRYFPSHVLSDGLLFGMESYSWFLTGLPDEKVDKKIDGRSWLLAASLLIKVLDEGKPEIIRNLANRFIITGDVRGNKIIRVEVGRKWQLAAHPAFKDFKWIVPEDIEMSMPVLKTKKFGTVDKAFAFIERLINQETVNLIKMADAGSCHKPQEFLGFLKNWADPSEAVGGTNARQRLKESFEFNMLHHLGENKKEYIPACISIDDGYDKDRLMSYYGDVPQMFFTFARLGDSEMINLLKQRGFDINATDVTGATALDFAIEVDEDSAVIDLLKKFGGERRVYRIGSEKMRDAIKEIGYGTISKETRQFIKESFENGTTPNEVVKFRECDAPGRDWNDQGNIDDQSKQESYKCGYRRYSSTLMLEAMFSGDQDLVKLCLDHGGALEAVVSICYCEKLILGDSDKVELEYYPELAEEFKIAELLKLLPHDFNDDIVKMLKESERNGQLKTS